jgi:DNA-binding response OmpR family regulator
MDNSPQSTNQPSKKKILIIEDEKALSELYAEIFRLEGFDVDTASDGQEGYVAIYNGGYDLVLLDIILPKMDGLSVLEKIVKETPPLKNNGPIVILSNLSQDDTISKALTLGASGFMIKSDMTPDQIVSQVKNFLHINV